VKDYFPRTEFQRLGMSEVAIRALEKIADFVQAQQDLAQAQTDITENATDITALAANDVVLDGRLDTAETDITALELAVARATGWGAYINTAGTQALAGTTLTSLVNNAGTVIETQKPSDITSFYSAGKITGREGDAILVNTELTFTPTSGVASYLQLSIDIGGAIGQIYHRDFSIVLGSGIAHKISYSTGAYTLDTWEANGGTVKVYSDGPGDITGVRYVIHRLHKAL